MSKCWNFSKLFSPFSKILTLICSLILCASFFTVWANPSQSTADDVTKNADISISGGGKVGTITDKSHKNRITLKSGDKITIKNPKAASHLYIIWDTVVGEWSLNGDGTNINFGEHEFLHEYINLKESFKKEVGELIISIPENGAKLCEIYVFTDGELPDFVQIWTPPHEKADIVLFSTHSDDEQLFFSGILPHYVNEVKALVQVVYLVHHFDIPTRPHEQLNGLWTVGVNTYPVMGRFPDLFSESLKDAFTAFKAKNYAEDDFVEFQVELIRRFKPQVVIGHDVDGEYGHGSHILNTRTLIKALEISNDSSKYPESATFYGVHDVPKTYLHLWKENKIVMDWDVPLKSLDGKTAFQVSQKGYACHDSQQWTWFTRWIKGTANSPISKASQIKKYNPCEYGLFRSTVGNDVLKNDFLENVVLYDKQIPVPEPTESEAPTTKASQLPTKPSTTASSPKNTVVSRVINVLIVGVAIAFAVVLVILIIVFVNRKGGRRK